jgi:tRNA threonylcarbamoyladenosine biosynthesis protein TsaB
VTGAPVVLALDTASATGGVALVRGQLVLGEETWQTGRQQTAEVLPAAVRLWERAELTPDEIDAVAVSAGPGSYTGLRVGFSLAKGFALARGLPVVAVPTLEAVAYQHREAAPRLWAVVDAGRGQVHAATFKRDRGGVVQQGDYAVLTPDELAGRLAGETRPVLVCGELYPLLAEALRPLETPGRGGPRGSRAGAPLVRLASPAATLRRPAFLAEIALLRLARGEVGDAAALQPLYHRRAP